MNIKRWILLSGALLIALELIPSYSFACGACYGAADSSLTAGMNMGILSLLGVTGGVLGSFMTFFLYLRKRAKAFVASTAKQFSGEDGGAL